MIDGWRLGNIRKDFRTEDILLTMPMAIIVLVQVIIHQHLLLAIITRIIHLLLADGTRPLPEDTNSPTPIHTTPTKKGCVGADIITMRM